MPKRSQKSNVGRRKSTKKNSTKRKGPSRTMGSSGNVNRAHTRMTHMSSLNNSSQQSTNYLRTSSLGDGTVSLEGRETILVATGSAEFSLGVIPIHPLNSSVFPRLSGIADLYQRYRFKSLRLRYVPACPAITAGSVGLAWQTDAVNIPLSSVPASMAGFGDMASGATGSVCYELQSFITFDREFPWYDMQSLSTEEMATWASALIAFDGFATTTAGLTCGYVYLEYAIELKFPNIAAPVSFEAAVTTPGLKAGLVGYVPGTGVVTLWCAPSVGLCGTGWSKGQFGQRASTTSLLDLSAIGTTSAGTIVSHLSDDYNLYLPRNNNSWTFYFEFDTSHTTSPGAPGSFTPELWYKQSSDGNYANTGAVFTTPVAYLINGGSYYRYYFQVSTIMSTSLPPPPYRMSFVFTETTPVDPSTTDYYGFGVSQDPSASLAESKLPYLKDSSQYQKMKNPEPLRYTLSREDSKSEVESPVYVQGEQTYFNLAPKYRGVESNPRPLK